MSCSEKYDFKIMGSIFEKEKGLLLNKACNQIFYIWLQALLILGT